ncbi:hypothetical protein HAX54_002632 [Datura stramonium]|uniref:Uncharacterized protein n=1 Tax=Datura stramonium TaxID=4076 RepID=A0ABS8WTV9_DATST|nr:hypothetical protein [Datura stramonium]
MAIHLLFQDLALEESAKTWNSRKNYSELWWEPNVTRGFVWLDEKPQENETWPESSPPYRVSSEDHEDCEFELGLEDVRWFVMGAAMQFSEDLVTVLGKYDHNEMYYIGGNSESVERSLAHFCIMAYGGELGIAIDYPLAGAREGFR